MPALETVKVEREVITREEYDERVRLYLKSLDDLERLKLSKGNDNIDPKMHRKIAALGRKTRNVIVEN